MSPQPQPQPRVNPRGAVDLNRFKASEEQKTQAIGQALFKAGLLCPCGERIRKPVTYYEIVEREIPSPQGSRAAMACVQHARCSTGCVSALPLEATAVARRHSDGRIAWLDEVRARAAAVHGQG